jgi:hypothetical protein
VGSKVADLPRCFSYRAQEFELSLLIIFVFDGFVQPHSCIPMSIWVLLYIYRVEVCFLWIASIYGPKSSTFLVVLNLTSGALFLRVSAMSVFGRGIIPSILLRFEPVFSYYWW